MKGWPVAVAKILVMSPSVKIKVTPMRNPRAALGTTDHIMAFGSVSEAS